MSVHEECGVLGVYSRTTGDVASLVYYGLYALLPTVLECIQSVIDKTGYILGCSAVHTKDTTFFMDAQF